MSKSSDWQLLAVALMQRLGGKVELTADEISEAKKLLDPVEYESHVISYNASQLNPMLLTVELRARPRSAQEALEALPASLMEDLANPIRLEPKATSFRNRGRKP